MEKKIWEVLPLDDVEFGYEWVNTELGEHIIVKLGEISQKNLMKKQMFYFV